MVVNDLFDSLFIALALHVCEQLCQTVDAHLFGQRTNFAIEDVLSQVQNVDTCNAWELSLCVLVESVYEDD